MRRRTRRKPKLMEVLQVTLLSGDVLPYAENLPSELCNISEAVSESQDPESLDKPAGPSFMATNLGILTPSDVSKVAARVRQMPIVDELEGKSAFLNARALGLKKSSAQRTLGGLSSLSFSPDSFCSASSLAHLRNRFLQQSLLSYSQAISRFNGNSQAMIMIAAILL